MIAGALITIASLSPQAKAATTIDVENLARQESSFAYCEKIDPMKTPLYQRGVKAVVGGHSEAEIALDRRSKDYVQTRLQFNNLLNGFPQAALFKACRNYLAGK
jgi:hypothetical protein